VTEEWPTVKGEWDKVADLGIQEGRVGRKGEVEGKR